MKCLEKRKENRWRGMSILIDRLKTKQGTEQEAKTIATALEMKESSGENLKVSEEKFSEGTPPIKRVKIVVNKLGRFTTKQIAEIIGLNEEKTEKLLRLVAVKVNDKEWVSKQVWEELKKKFDDLTKTQFLKIKDVKEKLEFSEITVRRLAIEIGAKIITETIVNPKMRIELPEGNIDIETLAIGYNTTPSVILAALKPKIMDIIHIKTLKYGGKVTSVAWSPDGRYIACGGYRYDGSEYYEAVAIWDVKEGKLMKTLKYGGKVTSVAWSPDGRYIACGGYRYDGSKYYGAVAIWKLEGEMLIKTLEHEREVTSVAWSPDGRYIACGGYRYDGSEYYGAVAIWDVKEGKLMKTLGHEGEVTSVAWSPDGRYIASSSNQEIKEEDWEEEEYWEEDPYMIIKVWDIETGSLIKDIRWSEGAGVYSITWSPDGYYIASGFNKEEDYDYTVSNVEIWELIYSFTTTPRLIPPP